MNKIREGVDVAVDTALEQFVFDAGIDLQYLRLSFSI
jgi:hypothetical protein